MTPIPYIRTADGPNGSVRPIPAGINFYMTPAIWIENPADPNQDRATAVADTDQLVVAEVGNLGTAAAAGELTVQFWAAGFGTVSGFATTLGGSAGLVQAAPAVPAGSVAVPVKIAWHPQAAELGGLPERHFCIRANVFLTSNPGDQLADGNQINVPAQARHGQRNMTLVPHDTQLREFAFEIMTGNPNGEEAERFKFEVREVLGRFDAAELVHLRESRFVGRAEGNGGLTLRGVEKPIAIRAARERSVRGLKLQLRDKAFKPHEERAATLRAVFADDEVGLVRRFDVLQHGRDGVVGAARVMTLALPEELLDPDRKRGYGLSKTAS